MLFAIAVAVGSVVGVFAAAILMVCAFDFV